MKSLLVLALVLTSSLAQAIPVVCESHESLGVRPLVRVKVNAPRDYMEKNGDISYKYLLGVTHGNGVRKIIYASGRVDAAEVGLNIVENQFLTGYMKVLQPNEDGSFHGEVSIKDIEKGKKIEVTCVDEAPQE